MIAELIRARPADEDPLTAIRQALTGALRLMPAAEVSTVLVRARLILGVPALRARQVEAQRTTRQLFAGAIIGRGDTTPFERDVLAAVALSALTVAIDTLGRRRRPRGSARPGRSRIRGARALTGVHHQPAWTANRLVALNHGTGDHLGSG